MKIQNKAIRYLVYTLILLASISLVAFLSISAYVHHDTKKEVSATEPEPSTSDTQEEEVSTTTTEPETSDLTDAQETYSSFYFTFSTRLSLFDKMWDEVWTPNVELAEQAPNEALVAFTMIADSYEQQVKDLEKLPFPEELDSTDAISYNNAVSFFTKAMQERQRAALYASASIKRNVYNEQEMQDAIHKAEEASYRYFEIGANLIVKLNEKYGYTP